MGTTKLTALCRTAWIDINLMVTPQTIGLLLRAINLPSSPSLNTTPIRTVTADTLLETVGKGMPAGDKLRLFEVLDVAAVLTGLQEVGREGRRTEADDETELLREKLAKLLNGVGGELCKIIEDVRWFSSLPFSRTRSPSPSFVAQNSCTPEAKLSSSNFLTSLLPLLLRFISDPSDVISLSSAPFCVSLLSLYKKEKKRAGAGNNMDDPTMTDTKRAFLTELLKASVGKMEYKEGVEWEMGLEGEEDEEQVAFAEMRKVSPVPLSRTSSPLP